MQAMGSDRLRALLRDLAPDDCRLLECRIVDGWHLRRYRRAPRGAARCFGGPGASAANRSEAESEGARSLRLRRRRTGRGARPSLLRRWRLLEEGGRAGEQKRLGPSEGGAALPVEDRKSTRLNSSHLGI